MMATMTWEEFLGWELHFIRCLGLRYGLLETATDPPLEGEAETPEQTPQGDEVAYQRIQDYAADWATQEAEEARR